MRPTPRTLLLLLFAAVLLVYANHFNNAFHFDDSHTVTDNPYIRSLSNLPKIFTDSSTFSVLPTSRVYRPIVTASLALDYWVGGGLKPFAYHLSTFLWYLVQLALMFLLFRHVFDLAAPNPHNALAAFFAAAWYGVHPAMAETVNYVIQRGDLYSTLGVIAALYLYAAVPTARRLHIYLIPPALALLSKPPALIFPAILFAYLWLFDDPPAGPQSKRLAAVSRQCLPSLALTIALAILQAKMLTATFVPTTGSPFDYRITQPFIALRYFIEFFAPLWLSADTDRVPFTSPFDPAALAGFLFVILLIAACRWLARRRQTRPAAFGIIWFLLALFPTSIFPLAEVENDHRMFFPFVGLSLAVTWLAALALRRLPKLSPAAIAAAAACLLCAYGWGAHQRNQVWRTEESLWLDVTEKSPTNGRGLMNYGLTQMAKGDYFRALVYLERALNYTPNYFTLETNLGIANGALHLDADADRHFQRAIALAPADSLAHFYRGRWLWQANRPAEAIAELKTASSMNSGNLEPQYFLMQMYAAQHDWPAVRETANQVLAIVPGDSAAAGYLSRAQSGATDLQVAEQTAHAAPTPENFLNLSHLYHHAGRYQACIEAAQQALKLRPDYAEAWNNIAAAYEALSQWPQAIQASREAVRLKPDFQLARNNLAFSESKLKQSQQP